jgi:DNA-binding transcriptional LysR family regulator
MLVASPDYLARRSTPKVPADLLEHTCLHYRFPHSGKLEPWELRRAAGGPELELPISMICNNIETRVCFALQGLGIAYLPEFSIKEPLADGLLRVVLDGYAERKGVFHVLWPASKHPLPKVRALVDFLGARVFQGSKAKRRNPVSRNGTEIRFYA